MIKVYFCPKCRNTAYMSKHTASCIKCNVELQYLHVPYETFIHLNQAQREAVIKANMQ